MILNGKEVRFSITDPRDAKKYEEAIEKLKAREQELLASGNEYTLQETMQEIIKICRETIQDMTGMDVLKGCHDASKAKEVLYQFFAEVTRQNQAFISPFNPDRIH